MQGETETLLLLNKNCLPGSHPAIDLIVLELALSDPPNMPPRLDALPGTDCQIIAVFQQKG